MIRGTLEIELCFETVDSVSLWGLGVKLDTPLSLRKVMSCLSRSTPMIIRYLQERPAILQTKMRN